MQNESKSHRLPLMIELSLLAEIEKYRFGNRLSTRAEAVRHLIKEGLSKAESKTTTEAEM